MAWGTTSSERVRDDAPSPSHRAATAGGAPAPAAFAPAFRPRSHSQVGQAGGAGVRGPASGQPFMHSYHGIPVDRYAFFYGRPALASAKARQHASPI